MRDREITDKQLDLMRHALGYNYSPRHDRNMFCAGIGTDDHAEILKLCDVGLMRAGRAINEGTSRYYFVTEEGHALVRAKQPPAPKLTRSQKRYREWLHADVGCSFREWLGIKSKAEREHEEFMRRFDPLRW